MFLSWCELNTLKVMTGLHDIGSLVGGGGVLPDNVLDLYHIPSAVHLIFHPSHLFMNVCLRVSECVVSVVYLFCL